MYEKTKAAIGNYNAYKSIWRRPLRLSSEKRLHHALTREVQDAYAEESGRPVQRLRSLTVKMICAEVEGSVSSASMQN